MLVYILCVRAVCFIEIVILNSGLNSLGFFEKSEWGLRNFLEDQIVHWFGTFSFFLCLKTGEPRKHSETFFIIVKDFKV